MQERMTERINVLTTKTQKVELEIVVEEKKSSQGQIVREALELLFQQMRRIEGKD